MATLELKSFTKHKRIIRPYGTENWISKGVKIRDLEHLTFRTYCEAIDWFQRESGLTSSDHTVDFALGSWRRRPKSEGSFAREATFAARRKRKAKRVAAAKAEYIAKHSNNAATSTDDMNASIQIRRHPFSSPEARFLVAELDKSLAEFYPDWDELVHPNMHHENNPHPPDEEIAGQAARKSAEGGEEVDLEDQEMKDGLVFWVAFDTAATDAENSNGKPIACAALRPFSPQNLLPLELAPALRYAELKRMFVLPPYQGRGISKLLLARVEQYALHNLELDALVIETGLRQKASLRLYEGAGYQRRSMFGQYVGADPESGGDSTCLEKGLK